MAIPDLIPLTEGRWQARCGFCKVESMPVAATSSADAWTDLMTLGWVPYRPVPAAFPKPLCAACGAKNAAIIEAVERAKKGRKRK